MRLFTAIDFPDEVKKKIFSVQTELRNSAEKGRFKHSSNFHLTLKFLDEVSEADLPALIKALATVAEGSSPFYLSADRLGYFKGREGYRVIWLGMQGDLEKLKALHARSEAALEVLGFRRENRAYTPHITIAQDVTMRQGDTFEKVVSGISLHGIPSVNARSMVLMKSEQIGPKRVYTPIREFALKG